MMTQLRYAVLRNPAVAALLAALLMVSPAAADTGTPCEFVEGQLQLRLAPGFTIDEINLSFGTTTVDSLPPLYLIEVGVPGSEAVVLQQLQQDPRVVEAELAYTNETPEAVRQMVVGATGGTVSEFVDQSFTDRINLDDIQSHGSGAGVLVAVLDSGVAFTHPAFGPILSAAGYDFVDLDADPSEEANGLDDDADGFADEGAGHGTMVAGLVHLVAPSADILPIRVLDDEGRGTTFDVAKAIRYAVDGGADVLNLSLGLDCESVVIGFELDAAAAAGLSIVAAAGNDGEERSHYPADDSVALSVTALDSVDIKADFANYDASISLSAPGAGLLAPFHDGNYAIGAGTSFATPIIAGQCALIRSISGALSKSQVDDLAKDGVVDVDQLPGNGAYAGLLGTGRIDGVETWNAIAQVVSVSDASSKPPSPLRLYPNPAPRDRGVSIGWSAGATSSTVRVFDSVGRFVRALSIGPAATVKWDALDAAGRRVAPGVYHLRLDGADGAQSIVLR